MELALSNPVDISIVMGCLNEVDNVEPLALALKDVLLACGVSYEIIYIDNGSTDGTVDVIRRLCAADPTIRLIVNTSNFGYLRSPVHGIYQAEGRAVIGMCSDFQDPPALVSEFIARWRSGARIVLGVRQSERQPLMMRIIRALGYGFFQRFGDYRLIPGATGFGLYDRTVVECLKLWRDPEPFFRGMLVESGYAVQTVPFHRPPRASGESKNKIGSLVNFAMITLGSAGKKFLRAPIFIAVAVFAIALATFFLGLAEWLFGVHGTHLLATAALELAFGLIFLFLGLMGEQIRLISEMVRNVPLVTEKERVNFPFS